MIGHAKKFISHPLFSGSALMIGGSMVINGVNYFYHLIMGRMLGPESYGTLASLFSVLYIVSIVPASSSFAIVKFISSVKNKSERGLVFTAIKKLFFYIAIIGSLVMVLTSKYISTFLNTTELYSIILLAGVFFFSLITLVNQSSLQGILDFKGVVGPNFISSFLKLLLGVLFVYLGWSVFGSIVALLIGVIFAYLYSIRLANDKGFIVKRGAYSLKPFIFYAIPVLVQVFAFTSIFTTDLILVKHFLSSNDAGLYAALSNLGKIIFFAAHPVTLVMFPIVSGRVSKGEDYKKVFYLSILLTLGLSFAIIGFYYLFPNIAIGVMYGSKYLAAKQELVWMGLFIGIYTLDQLVVNFLLSINKTKVVLVPLLAAITQVVAIWFFHDSIMQVIQVSLMVVTALFFILAGYLGYNQLQGLYVDKK